MNRKSNIADQLMTPTRTKHRTPSIRVAINNVSTTTKYSLLKGQQRKTLQVGALFIYQFTGTKSSSSVMLLILKKICKLVSSHGGFLTNAIYYQKETIKSNFMIKRVNYLFECNLYLLLNLIALQVAYFNMINAQHVVFSKMNRYMHFVSN